MKWRDRNNWCLEKLVIIHEKIGSSLGIKEAEYQIQFGGRWWGRLMWQMEFYDDLVYAMWLFSPSHSSTQSLSHHPNRIWYFHCYRLLLAGVDVSSCRLRRRWPSSPAKSLYYCNSICKQTNLICLNTNGGWRIPETQQAARSPCWCRPQVPASYSKFKDRLYHILQNSSVCTYDSQIGREPGTWERMTSCWPSFCGSSFRARSHNRRGDVLYQSSPYSWRYGCVNGTKTRPAKMK